MVRKILSYIQQYKKYVFIGPIFVVLEVICELSMPLLMARIVDIGIANMDLTYIWHIGIIMIVLAVAAIVFGSVNIICTSISSQGFAANIRQSLFYKIQTFSFANIDRFSTASLVTRLTNDVNVLQNTLMMSLRLLIRAPIMLVCALILAVSINGQLALILMFALPILAVAIVIIMKRGNKLYAVMQKKIDGLNSTVQENLIAIRVVKSFVRMVFEKTKFKKSNDELMQAAMKASNNIIIIMPIMMLVLNGATLAVIWFGGKMVGTQVLGTGELMGFISYIMQIMISLMMIAMIFLFLSRAKACGERVLEVLETQPDIQDASIMQIEQVLDSKVRGKVEFCNVSFKYATEGAGDAVLQDVSFVAEPGEVIGIIGGTGTGKSTLVNLIPRFYDVTSGKVQVDDVDVRDYPLAALRQKIGMVLQNNVLFSGTIAENLRWGNPKATDEEIREICKDAQIDDFISSLPEQYESHVEQGGTNFSGGQKQRLCIARAMLKKPEILILDDSTSAVDSATESKIRESFYHNFSHTTVFIIAQRIMSVRSADKIIVFDDGKIVGFGTHEELLLSNSIYREIITSQQEEVSA